MKRIKNIKILCIFFILIFSFPLSGQGVEFFILQENKDFKEIVSAFKRVCRLNVKSKTLNKKEKISKNSIILGYKNLIDYVGESSEYPLMLLLSLSPYTLENSEQVNSIVIYPDPANVVKMIKNLTNRKRIAIAYSYGASDVYMRRFRLVFEREKFIVFPIVSGAPSGFFVRLRKIEENVDIIFTVLDPMIITPESFVYLYRYSKSKGKILIAPTREYFRIGGDMVFLWDSKDVAEKGCGLYKKLIKGETGIVEYMPVSGCIIRGSSKVLFNNPSICKIE